MTKKTHQKNGRQITTINSMTSISFVIMMLLFAKLFLPGMNALSKTEMDQIENHGLNTIEFINTWFDSQDKTSRCFALILEGSKFIPGKHFIAKIHTGN